MTSLNISLDGYVRFTIGQWRMQKGIGRWHVLVKIRSPVVLINDYVGAYLVVATGENSQQKWASNGRNANFTVCINIYIKRYKTSRFDAIVFVTGYRSTVKKWLKDDGNLFNEDGKPKQRNLNHWKGEKGFYCAGFSYARLFGISNDAQNIDDNIESQKSKSLLQVVPS
ncbi:hypothetical protein LguiA_018272 [Lonicera macranthoides]